jgi:hypothetical protein
MLQSVSPAVMYAIAGMILSSATTAVGRVGEQIAQCDSRYGSPKEVKGTMRVYKRGEMMLGATTCGGTVCMIVYKHANETPLSRSEKDAILSLYGNWRKEYSRGKPLWTLRDARGFVAMEDDFGTFCVMDPKAVKGNDSRSSRSIRDSL